MEEQNEPQHFIKVCVSRELTQREFEEITEIVDDEISDIVASDNVIEYLSEDDMFCYMFTLYSNINKCEQGPAAADLIEFEIDQIIPDKLSWNLEVSSE